MSASAVSRAVVIGTAGHIDHGKSALVMALTGTDLYGDVRVSPDGQRIAFNEHPEKGDDRGVVAVVDLKGAHKILTPQYPAIEGLAWTSGGKID